MQQLVKSSGVDAWVMYDFRGTNSLAWKMLNLKPNAHCTRRWVVVIPAHSAPFKIVHQMERIPLSHVEIEERIYATAAEYEQQLTNGLRGFTRVAMEYSPMNQIPVASKVDAGTIEFIRSIGLTVESSADLSQSFTAVLTDSQIERNELTAKQLRGVVIDAFEFVRTALLADTLVTEYDVQQHILSEFDALGLITESSPIVAIGPNAASPHYAPSKDETSRIEKDMVLLIDAWAREGDAADAVYADITWMGYTGAEVPSDVAEAFHVMASGRNAGLNLVKQRFLAGEPVFGFEVDDACRAKIVSAGRGADFIHRTGHNITTELHGPGVNMDNFETHDTRRILPGTSFSIEPGLYITGGIGMRTEIDVVIKNDGTVCVPTAPMQETVMPLLADEWKQ
ncbi:MAG: aminopeptidase P family protein [Ignavibacteria bacterium]|nr:aminopeptidase P family protein [Ignavibacteria bacterium]